MSIRVRVRWEADFAPQHLNLQATAEERAALAEQYSVPSVHAVSADLRLASLVHLGGYGMGIGVTGKITCALDLNCVSTLEDFRFHAEQDVDMHLVLHARRVDDDFYNSMAAPDVVVFARHKKQLQYDLGEYIGETVALLIPSHPIAPHAPLIVEAGAGKS